MEPWVLVPNLEIMRINTKLVKFYEYANYRPQKVVSVS